MIENKSLIKDILIEEDSYSNIEDTKVYKNNDEHNESTLLDYWWQNSPEGKTLFVVLYTKSCAWNRCEGCNLPMLSSSKSITPQDITKQIDYIFNYIIKDDDVKNVNKVILSNNGSMFDEKTFPTPLLNYLFLQLAMKLPNLKKVALETRPEFCSDYSLQLIDNVLNSLRTEDSKIKIEIAIGFEIFDTKLRNRNFKKGLSFKLFEAFVDNVIPYGYEIKTYFMLKPIIGMTEEEGKEDIIKAIDYIDKIRKEKNATINIHLNPTYAARETILEEAFYKGTFVPPKIPTVIELLIYANKKGIEIFTGLNDEGLAVEGGTCLRTKDLKYVDPIEDFNQSQNSKKLEDFYTQSLNEVNDDEDESRIIKEAELIYLESEAKEIIIITPTLENDIDAEGEIFNIVKQNLKNGKIYTYVIPFNKETLNAKKKYENIHNYNKEQVSFFIVPEDDFLYMSETIIYDFNSSRPIVLEWKPAANNTYIKLDDYFKEKVLKLTTKLMETTLEVTSESELYD